MESWRWITEKSLTGKVPPERVDSAVHFGGSCRSSALRRAAGTTTFCNSDKFMLILLIERGQVRVLDVPALAGAEHHESQGSQGYTLRPYFKINRTKQK